jgi:hypothetical protein
VVRDLIAGCTHKLPHLRRLRAREHTVERYL